MTNDTIKNLTSELKRVFEESRLTQDAFAERFGISKRTLIRYLTGDTVPKGSKAALVKRIIAEIDQQPVQIQDPGEGLIQGLGPDTIQTLTRDMTRWQEAWEKGGITEAQLQKAVDLILKQMEALTSGDNGGSKSEEITDGSETEKRATS